MRECGGLGVFVCLARARPILRFEAFREDASKGLPP